MKLIFLRFFITCFIILFVFISSCRSKAAIYDPPHVKEAEIVINTETLMNEVPEFFSYNFNGRNLNFFVLKIGNSVESYIDACAKCYSYKKGYSVEDSYIKCNYCNVRYPIDSLKEGVGGCHPIILEGKLNGNEYIILIEDLKKIEKYF